MQVDAPRTGALLQAAYAALRTPICSIIESQTKHECVRVACERGAAHEGHGLSRPSGLSASKSRHPFQQQLRRNLDFAALRLTIKAELRRLCAQHMARWRRFAKSHRRLAACTHRAQALLLVRMRVAMSHWARRSWIRTSLEPAVRKIHFGRWRRACAMLRRLDEASAFQRRHALKRAFGWLRTGVLIDELCCRLCEMNEPALDTPAESLLLPIVRTSSASQLASVDLIAFDFGLSKKGSVDSGIRPERMFSSV